MSQTSLSRLLGIPTGEEGESIFGVTIKEQNRATVFERRRGDVEILQKIAKENYRDKGVSAVVVGVLDGTKYKYAVYVQDDFLVEIGGDGA